MTTSVVAAFDTIVAASSPKRTEVVPARFVPVIVTRVPPAAGPLAGEMVVIDGDPATRVEKLIGVPV